MRSTIIFVFILGLSIIISCSVKKQVLTDNELSSDKMLIVGLIEYDYSQLKSKNIKGVELFFESDQEFSDFSISKKYLPKEYLKKYEFVSKIGNKGDYELFYKNRSETPETDRLLTQMDHQRTINTDNKKSYAKYFIKDGKILNIGKLIVKYYGGDVGAGSIRYSYSFQMEYDDTIAIQAFRNTYPTIYNKYKNDIYLFKSEFQKCLEYVLNHLTEGKQKFIISFMEDNPNRIKIVFKDLSLTTQDKYIEDIEKLSFEELNDFFNNIE